MYWAKRLVASAIGQTQKCRTPSFLYTCVQCPSARIKATSAGAINRVVPLLSQGIRCARDAADDAGSAAGLGLGAGVGSRAPETGAKLAEFVRGVWAGCGTTNVTPVHKKAPKIRKLEQIRINARILFVMLRPSSLKAGASTKRVLRWRRNEPQKPPNRPQQYITV